MSVPRDRRFPYRPILGQRALRLRIATGEASKWVEQWIAEVHDEHAKVQKLEQAMDDLASAISSR